MQAGETLKMNERHLPLLNARFWFALCLASIFGANLGDFFAHNIGLGHLAGLPFLAAGFALILVAERYDRGMRDIYYWLAIVVIRTAATNIGDLLAGDLKWPRPWVMAGLAILLAIVVSVIHERRRRVGTDRRRELLTADGLYWIGMLLAGALGTVIGDYVSHNLGLGDPMASLVLGIPLVLLFMVGSRGPLWWAPFFWLTVVTVRADGTVGGDWFAGRHMLGLQLSTALSGLVFVALLLAWKDRRSLSAA
jgi:uncharacterized membrane-anchored protein